MSVVHVREKTILAKVVYYGPPLGGKTTSLKHIHRVMDPERRTQLISLNTENDRTLFFDFLPLNLGRIGDFSLKIQGFTVPGQVKYLLTRRYVLRGADAVVFVADSRAAEKEGNAASLADLRGNLAFNGMTPEDVPVVLEYNKRDEADLLSLEEMEALLNPGGAPSFPTVATVGTGVFEAFTAAAVAMVRRIARDHRLGREEESAEAVRAALERVQSAWTSFRGAGAEAGAVRDPAAAARAREADVVVVGDADAMDAGLSVDRLLEKALGTNMQVAELLSQVQEARSALEARVAEVSALHRLSAAAAATLEEDRVVREVVEGAAEALGASHSSILLRDEEDGALRERAVHGFPFDPLVAGGAAATGPSPLTALLESPGPVVIDGGGPPGALEAIREREPSVRAAVAAPLRVRDEPRGLILVYFTGPGLPPGESAARFLGAVAAGASVALENARLHGELERFNRRLEARVAERTRELREAYAELQELDQLKDDFLSSMSHELMTPLSGIRSSAEILRTYTDLSPEERAEFVAGIEHEAERLTGRLQDILDLAALDAGKVSFVLAPGRVEACVEEALGRTAGAFGARGVKTAFRPAADLPPVLLDPRWLGRALDHVLDNAAKFAPEGSEVEVTVDREGAEVRVEVRDRGPGIPVEERDSLFHRFKQIGDVLTDKPAGIGAGLPLTRRIVEAHGGVVGIDGAPGRGTALWMRLPSA